MLWGKLLLVTLPPKWVKFCKLCHSEALRCALVAMGLVERSLMVKVRQEAREVHDKATSAGGGAAVPPDVSVGVTPPKAFRWVMWAVPALLIFYFFGGLATKRIGEVFPVFHWALFASFSEEVTRYEVRVVEQDGQRFDPPLRLQETEEYSQWMAASHDIYHTPKVIRYFGATYEAGREARAEELRAAFERNFLPGDEVRYQLVKLTYNPLERYRTGAVQEASVLGEFSKTYGGADVASR